MSDRTNAGRIAGLSFASALSLALAVTIATGAKARAAGDPDAVKRRVEAFLAAQQAFDPAKLAALTTPDYLEISPAGALDPRERMLDFYAPDRKVAAPQLTIRDSTVRTFGDSAVLIATIAYAVPEPGQPARSMELRAGFVAHRAAGDWKIASAQYTPIRMPAK